jgi:hypothetical protein
MSEHGPPSVSAPVTKWIIRVTVAIFLAFIAVDGVLWVADRFGGDHAEHVEPAEHDDAADHGTSADHGADDAHADDHHGPAISGWKHVHYGFEQVPGFHAIYGFAGCVFLVLAAIVLRKIVMRPEDYYDV